MKGWSGYVNSPLKQDTIPDWSMSQKHYQSDVGYGHRVKGDRYAMDNKYFYTSATKENPHGTREELSNFDKIIHRVDKVRKYIKHNVLGKKRREQIEKEEIDKIKKSISDDIEAAEFNRFLQDFPFEEGQR